ncbi:MAG: cytochrome C [Pseudomonadota bacterium]
MTRIIATLIAWVLASPAMAEGDVEKGKRGFNKCKACHLIANDAGDVIVKGGKTGPNLYGLSGRTAGTVADYRYGASLVEAGEAGLIWDEANFVEYTQDPKAFLKTYLDSTRAKSKMSFRLKKGAEDIYAYIESVSTE